jgi:hypothetical protein
MINKNILSEIALYYGKVKMPKGWEVEKDILVKNATVSQYYDDVKYPFTKPADRINTYITEFIYLEHKLLIEHRENYGSFYERNQVSKPQFHLNYASLKEGFDFVLLYGIEIDPKTCEIVISYDDNRRKNLEWTINLETGKFIMFPTSLNYYINNKNNSYLNYIQTYIYKKY